MSTAQLETLPFDAATVIGNGSDIAEVHFVGGRFEVLVASTHAEDGRIKGLRITFAYACKFRMLDEAELSRYWASPGFLRGHHVLFVASGGWDEEESSLQGLKGRRSPGEWLIVTGNRCVSVIASEVPQVAEIELDDVT